MVFSRLVMRIAYARTREGESAQGSRGDWKLGERIKIQNKKVIAYQRTVGGLFQLTEKIREYGLPEDATVDWRQWALAEFCWSNQDDIHRSD
jgi:hypothetical protein